MCTQQKCGRMTKVEVKRDFVAHMELLMHVLKIGKESRQC